MFMDAPQEELSAHSADILATQIDELCRALTGPTKPALRTAYGERLVDLANRLSAASGHEEKVIAALAQAIKMPELPHTAKQCGIALLLDQVGPPAAGQPMQLEALTNAALYVEEGSDIEEKTVTRFILQAALSDQPKDIFYQTARRAKLGSFLEDKAALAYVFFLRDRNYHQELRTLRETMLMHEPQEALYRAAREMTAALITLGPPDRATKPAKPGLLDRILNL